jgi:hypothetical protein
MHCTAGGMVPSTGMFCGFLDYAARTGAKTCRITRCACPVPAPWRTHYELREAFATAERAYHKSTDPVERRKFAEAALQIAEKMAVVPRGFAARPWGPPLPIS